MCELHDGVNCLKYFTINILYFFENHLHKKRHFQGKRRNSLLFKHGSCQKRNQNNSVIKISKCSNKTVNTSICFVVAADF